MTTDEARARLLLGLGNPGNRYANTRHNVGAWLVDALLDRFGVPDRRLEFPSACAWLIRVGGGALWLGKSTTYMNESGLAARVLCEHLSLQPTEVLVAHDELDLPLGALRLKRGGRDAGHRGLRSLTEQLGTDAYARLRIGIGRPGPTFVGTVADFVLEAVPLVEREALLGSVARAAEATRLCVDDGYAAAMNRVNQRDFVLTPCSPDDGGPTSPKGDSKMTTAQSVGAMPGREYETIYILRGDTTKESAHKVAERVGDAIGKEGGTLTGVENWGRRQLAYAVGKQRRGVYVYVKYVGGGAAVRELERNLRMLDDVIKFQTVLVSGEIDTGALAVDPSTVVFEDVEPPAEDEVEETLEERLGLVEGAPRMREDVDIDGDGDDGDDGDADADEEEDE
ncbi:MAG: aminoacyl-tRNA hydrolase [Polyangiaceae bacterium]